MLIKKKKLVLETLLVFLIVLVSAFCLNAQTKEDLPFQNKLKSIVSNFNNVRFSSISYYKLNDKEVKNIKGFIKAELGIGQQTEQAPNPAQQVNSVRIDSIVQIIKTDMRNQSQSDVENSFYTDPQYSWMNVTSSEIDVAYPLATSRAATIDRTDINDIFVLTTVVDDPNEVPEIIAVVLYTDFENLSKDEYEQTLIYYYNQVLGNSLASERNVITNPEAINMIDTTDGTSLYDKLVISYRQGNFIPITSEVRGIGTELNFVKSYGKSTSVITNENDITDADVETFIRITEGQPIDYIKQNEIIISPDYISYRRYDLQYYEEEDENGNIVTLPYGYANSNLPSYGAEVKFGLDEINYPSFFSERMMIRAIWDNIKLGLVLPTSGWSSFTKDVFNIDRRMTHAGVGLSGSLDFPIKVIPQSGVFSMSGSYVFGDAVAASYKDRNDDYYNENGYSYAEGDLFYNDYVVRFTGQMHYSFGFSIDESYLLRFGIGATVYGTETWHDFDDTNDLGEQVFNYKKSASETIGGISMKLEFMSRDISTPFGASLQYFDEAIYTGAWIEIPIVTNTFFLRFDAKGYVAAFKDTLHPWENKGVFMPSVRLIFNF